MTHPLPSFPPLFAPGEWWRLYLQARMEGHGEEDAIAAANARSGIRSREWLRFHIRGGATLSLPVEGGASMLKNGAPERWRLAREARREIRKASHTLATVYGSCPFFIHLSDTLLLEGETAEEVCRRAFGGILRLAGLAGPAGEDLTEGLRAAWQTPLVQAVRARLNARFDPSLSVIDLIVKLGPEAIFPLLPAF